MRVFLDANILFSAAKSDGAVRELLRRLVAHGHRLCADAYVVAEARRNLESKGRQALDAFEALCTTVEIADRIVAPEVDAELDWLPPKDRPVLAAAIRGRCEVLATGDRTHFGAAWGRAIGGVTILSPAMLAERLRV